MFIKSTPLFDWLHALTSLIINVFVLYVLSGISDFSYNFEVYTGEENDDYNREKHGPDIGAAGNDVRLA